MRNTRAVHHREKDKSSPEKGHREKVQKRDIQKRIETSPEKGT